MQIKATNNPPLAAGPHVYTRTKRLGSIPLNNMCVLVVDELHTVSNTIVVIRESDLFIIINGLHSDAIVVVESYTIVVVNLAAIVVVDCVSVCSSVVVLVVPGGLVEVLGITN
mgnify:CR=1 FL=1